MRREGASPRNLIGTIALALAVIFGCGEPDWRGAPVPPFQLGEVVGEGVPAPPKVEVLQPSSSTRLAVKPRQRIECAVRFTYPEGGRLPDRLIALFRDPRGADAGSFALEPKEKDGRSYTFARTLKTPPAPGTYRLLIDAVSLDGGTPDGSGTSSRQATEDTHTTITAADVEVRKR